MDVTLIRGDATEPWPLPDNSLDSVVTDPPYGIAFMGKRWDDLGGPQAYQEWTAQWAREAFRCLKPGGFLLAFGSPRMAHRMACGFEDAGFRIVDTIEWLYLTGFPKAQDIGKMFEKRAGMERTVIGRARRPSNGTEFHAGAKAYGRKDEYDITAPATPLAKKWDGWKTPSLKPAHEPIIMAQKPLDGTYIENIERWGVGAINVNACKVTSEGERPLLIRVYKHRDGVGRFPNGSISAGTTSEGRFPANVVTLDEDAWYSPYFNITPRELSKKAGRKEKVVEVQVPYYRLRRDLTPEQRRYVLQELEKHGIPLSLAES